MAVFVAATSFYNAGHYEMSDLLPADLDDETIQLVHDMRMEGALDAGASRLFMIDRLRRSEDFMRVRGATRQDFQKISSARRILGDKGGFGKIKVPFLQIVEQIRWLFRRIGGV
ncbi:hypothetical protein [Methylobacterium frigidaeris]|uniref:hypothetical protein n=1 Tax=Methylobacterium frigidaeris TaxID=2038277 RepID=UPI001EDCC3EA|nr:hypothetical protein [Methylobacterium frigidaeris]